MEKTKLSGGPDKTVTWIWLDTADGHLKVEHYDFSDEAHTFFGNDIAWTITVQDMEKLFTIVNKDESTLISWMEEYCKSYFDIKQWLEENGIEFSIDRESNVFEKKRMDVNVHSPSKSRLKSASAKSLGLEPQAGITPPPAMSGIEVNHGEHFVEQHWEPSIQMDRHDHIGDCGHLDRRIHHGSMVLLPGVWYFCEVERIK